MIIQFPLRIPSSMIKNISTSVKAFLLFSSKQHRKLVQEQYNTMLDLIIFQADFSEFLRDISKKQNIINKIEIMVSPVFFRLNSFQTFCTWSYSSSKTLASFNLLKNFSFGGSSVSIHPIIRINTFPWDQINFILELFSHTKDLC